MCKKQVSVPEVDNSKNLETSNYGLINLDENNLDSMGIFEVVSVILLVLAVIMTCHYCNRKRKQSRMRDLNNALKEGLSASTSVAYRSGSGALPVVQFENPGTRIVSMQARPSAPAQHSTQPAPAQLGLWEQCR